MKQIFSKDDTLVIKGVAIIFLVFYHCLSSRERLFGYDVNFFPLTEYYAYYIFESMNVCVGMFAFLSSYGLMRTISGKYTEMNAQNSTDFVTRRTVSLIMAFFIPYVVCTLLSLIFFDYNPYGKGEIFVFNMLSDMLGLAGMLGTPMMVGTWWYMSFALVIIWLMPFTVNIYRKYGIAVLIPYFVFPLFLRPDFYGGPSLTNMTRWLLCIPFGILFADAEIFEKMRGKQFFNNKVVSKLLKFVIFTLLTILCFRLRKQGWVWENAYYIISTVLPLLFIYWLYEFVCAVPLLNRILGFFGKYSSDIFFINTFVRVVWFKDITYSIGNWYGIFGFVMSVSLIMAVAAYYLRKLIKWDKLTKYISDKASVFMCGMIQCCKNQ